MIEVEHLSVATRRGKSLVQRVSLTLRDRSTLAIVGASGAGKSTLLYAIAGLLPSSLVVSGTVSRGERRLGRDIGVVFQEHALDPLMTVGAHLFESIRAFPSSQDVRSRALETLRECGVDRSDEWLKLYPHQLSGGMLQRVALALARVHRPGLLLLDEATSRLDRTTERAVLDSLRAFKDHSSMIVVTHDLAVAATLADEIALMDGGEIVEHGPTADVLRSARHPFTSRLVRAVEQELA